MPRYDLPTAVRHRRVVDRARGIVSQRFREKILLADLAAACGVSSGFLARFSDVSPG
jgi:hypothetical protein